VSVGPARTQAGISIAISPDLALVRTVRLVAAAVARQASASQNLIEQVRLAVGEACRVLVSTFGQATAETDELALTDKVQLRMDIGQRLIVSITCGRPELPMQPESGENADPWALLRGLAEGVVVTNGPRTVDVEMSWPL
jgi:Histidine kinase-like ATPase domain